MRVVMIAAALMLGACVPAPAPVTEANATPQMDFADYCAGCHGAGGKGDGAAAAGLAKKPADLTTLSARNQGSFPTTRVMAQIWGYTGKKGDGVMPDFSPLMAGAMVPFDGGDGIQTPTPIRLVALAEYLQSLQVK
ncbi:c-type cytochrome [Cypionkella sp.]|uniref:c-type cytochrome n=1 Tax=Cypionkella sp. TaxID=2811411 RepID=UPI002FDCDED2